MNAVAVAIVLALSQGSPSTEIKEPDLEKNLAAARALGLPVTLEEFLATLPTVPDAENGAIYYQEILGDFQISTRHLVYSSLMPKWSRTA
jgi:hypothetical protein